MCKPERNRLIGAMTPVCGKCIKGLASALSHFIAGGLTLLLPEFIWTCQEAFPTPKQLNLFLPAFSLPPRRQP